MKQKIYKVLSVVMALAMVFSMFACVAHAAETPQDVIVDGVLTPATAKGTVNGVNMDASNSINTSSPRLYAVNVYNVADFEEVIVAEGCRVYVHFFKQDNTWLGGSGWIDGATTKTFASMSYYNADAKFRITLSNKVDDTQTPPADGMKFKVKGGSQQPEQPEQREPIEATYYVSSAGDDANDGLTVDTPIATIGKAIEIGKAANYLYGDTVNVKLIKTDANIAWGTLTDYEFKLSISSNTDKAAIDMSSAVNLTGDVDFANVTLAFKNGSWPDFTFGSHSVSLGAGVSYENPAFNNFVLASKSGAQPEDINLYFESLPNTFRFGGMYASPTYKNITVTLNGPVSKGFTFGGQDNDRTTTFDGALNFNIKNTSVFTLANKGGAIVFTPNFAAQIINSTGNAAMMDDGNSETTTDPKSYFESKSAKYYILNNTSGLADAIEFTDTIGKYKVNFPEGFVVDVKNAEGALVEAPVADGILDMSALPAGVYTIEAYNPTPREMTVYVSPNGDDTAAGTEDAPVATLNGAIAVAKAANFTNIDTLKVKVVYVEGASALIDADAAKNAITGHVFALDVTSAGDQIASLGNEKGLTLGGKTSFDNINLKVKGSTDVTFNIGDNDLYVGKGVTVTGGTKIGFDMTTTYGHTFATERTLYIGSKDWTSTRQGTWGMPIYTAPYKVIFDNEGSADYNMAGYGRAGQFRGKFTFDIRSATSFTLRAVRSAEDPSTPYQITDAAVFELMNNSKADISAAVELIKGLKTTAGAPVPYYVYDNKTGLENAIELTDTLGKIKVNVDAQRFQLLANGNPVEVVDGYATLAAGAYDFTVKLIAPFNDTYYVKTGATNGDGTEAAPFATVAEAIAAANDKISVYGDNITIKLVGEEAVVWGETEEFAFVPVIESANKEVLSTIVIDESMKGNVVLDYVIVDTTIAPTNEGFKRLFVDGNNIKFGANVQGDIEFVAARQAGKYSKGQTVEINTVAVKNIYVGHTNQNNITFAGDVNYILNNAELNTRFNFMPYYGHKITINGNFNLKIAAANSVTIGKTSVEAEGDRQPGQVIITGEGKGANLIVPVATNVVGLDQFALLTDNYFVIRTGKEVDIDYTEFAGEYTFDYDEAIYNLVVTDAEGNVLVADTDYSYDDGILFFFAPGEYTVKLECIECIYDRECDTTCNRCGEVDETRVHKFSTYAPKDAAECGKNATEIAVCDYGCGTEDVRDVEGSALEHNYQWIIDKKNTCGKDGAKHEECSLCHAKRNENTVVKATGKHTYKTTTKKATTSKNGSAVKACSVCGKQASKTTIYYAKKVKLSTTEYTYNGKSKKPSVKVYDYKGNKISSSNYEVSYKDNKKVGKATVTIKFKGNYSGTLKATFKILPKESKVDKLTAAKKSLKVKIKKVSSQATGYEIQYSTSSKFSSKYTKTKKVTSYKTTSVTLKSLKAKKTYYVRVRTYKTVDGKKYYSDWSSKKSKKTK